MVRTKRAYDAAARADGYRVLVDRLWPRGVSKEALKLDAWAKDVAPSAALRQWFGHVPERFAEFSRRYLAELQAAPARPVVADLVRRARTGTVTLVYGARDAEHNGAVVLGRVLQRRLGRGTPRTARAQRSRVAVRSGPRSTPAP